VRALIEQLADGKFRSGTELGETLGCSRAAVWKQIEALRDMGVEVDAVKGRGYRARRPIELLEPSRLLGHVAAPVRKTLSGLEVHTELDSTNRFLMERSAELRSGHVCFAERQTAGRGRRGRQWVSPFGANLYMSMLWRFEQGAAGLSGLSLALGVGLARALDAGDARGVQLKWPNDVLWDGRKLAGILVELTGETGGPCDVVLGIGLNWKMPAHLEKAIGQPWADVEELSAGLGRNRLGGALITHLIETLKGFESDGFTAFADEWQRRDAYQGGLVSLDLGRETVAGVARGVDHDGALLLEVGGKLVRYTAGEISLRPARVDKDGTAA